MAQPIAAPSRPGAGPVGVVGSGLDVVYPRSHRDLWDDVAAAGVLLSEAPLGAAPMPWRFPARNRIIAALADILVVVESHAAGGSMHTVEAAIERGITVLAVPGSVRSAASVGTNRLLAAGCAPACDTDDVLAALNLDTVASGPTARRIAARPDAPAADRAVLEAVGWEPTSLDTILDRSRRHPSEVLATLDRLSSGGWVAANGAWWERRG